MDRYSIARGTTIKYEGKEVSLAPTPVDETFYEFYKSSADKNLGKLVRKYPSVWDNLDNFKAFLWKEHRTKRKVIEICADYDHLCLEYKKFSGKVNGSV